MLAAADPPQALRGLHALAALADAWPSRRQACVNALCAQLRSPSRRSPEAGLLVRRHVVNVIAARLRDGARVSWQGCDLDLRGAVLDGCGFVKVRFSAGRADFGGAIFSGDPVYFTDAHFDGALVSFAGARFATRVEFAGARFTGGVVDFAGATFASGTTDLSLTLFRRGIVEFTGAVFAGARVDFFGARFTGAQVGFQHARVAAGSVRFAHVLLARGRVSFRGIRLSGGTVDITGLTHTGGVVVLPLRPRTELPRPARGRREPRQGGRPRTPRRRLKGRWRSARPCR